MVICGIDYSISSPAVVKAILNDDFEIIDIDYLSFNSTLKMCKSDTNIKYNSKKKFKSDIERFQYLRDIVIDFIYNENPPEYISIEGYAMGGMGKVFNIAEATALVKTVIYDKGTPLRIYTPSAIKKYATGNGSAGKVTMFTEFNKIDEKLIDLSHLPDLKNPKEDIIDAYWIMRLLHTELLLRNGYLDLKSLSSKQIEVFNAVSKSQPENLLVRDFIKKDID